jgi:hypothetical protein
MDAKEERRKRDRERYARMSDEEKKKMLKNVVKPISTLKQKK